MNKSELRKIYKDKREQVKECDIEHLSIEISLNFFENFDLQKVRYVHCFLPVLTKKEINTWHIIEGLRVKYPEIELVVPVCINDEDMVCGQLQEQYKLIENKWGIPEPENAPIVTPDKIDLVILPLLAYDKKGNRIGYGKGFYDRFLSECRPDVFKIGLSFFEPVDEILDLNEFDVPVNAVVTPEHVFFFEVIR